MNSAYIVVVLELLFGLFGRGQAAPARSGREIVWHNGGTGGYRSFTAFDPKARTAVVVLSNMFTKGGRAARLTHQNGAHQPAKRIE